MPEGTNYGPGSLRDGSPDVSARGHALSNAWMSLFTAVLKITIHGCDKLAGLARESNHRLQLSATLCSSDRRRVHRLPVRLGGCHRRDSCR